MSKFLFYKLLYDVGCEIRNEKMLYRLRRMWGGGENKKAVLKQPFLELLSYS